MFDDALKSIKKSIELSDGIAESYKIEAEIYLIKEMYYHANESIKKALKLNPTLIEWKHLEIKILILLDEIKKAKSKFDDAFDESESTYKILNMFGNWYLKNKEIIKANKYFEMAKDINKNNRLNL